MAEVKWGEKADYFKEKYADRLEPETAKDITYVLQALEPTPQDEEDLKSIDTLTGQEEVDASLAFCRRNLSTRFGSNPAKEKMEEMLAIMDARGAEWEKLRDMLLKNNDRELYNAISKAYLFFHKDWD